MQQSKVQRIEELEFRNEIEQFTANLEKGDIGLAEFVDYGYVLYGQTRAGKTATGHLLSGNALKGNKIKGEDMVEVATSKFRKAVIGNTMNSQTLIPNFFEIQPIVKKQLQDIDSSSQKREIRTCIIDTPGYGDTYGVLRILANGYFHYRLYSRVRNMKFILCIDSIDLRNTAGKFIHTILEFTSSFRDYNERKEEIWGCCVFLFTKVEETQSTKEDLCDSLKAIANACRLQAGREVEENLKAFIRFMVDNKRVFYIKKFKKGDSCTTGHLLKEIDGAIPKWWGRKMDMVKNEVDMSGILFSISKPIILSTTGSDNSQRQFAELTRYYNIRIKEITACGKSETQSPDNKERVSLSDVLNELVSDAMGTPDQRGFLGVMESYVQKYYKGLDAGYKEDRQKTERELFYEQSASQVQRSQQRGFPFRDKNYLVKKFQALQQIEKLKQEINFLEFEERNLSWLQKCQVSLYSIIKQLARVSYKRQNATNIIFKYGYLIHRIIQQAKMFLLLTKLSTTPENERRLKQAADDEVIDIIRLLKDFMGLSYMFQSKEMMYEELQLAFIKRFDLQDERYKRLEVNDRLIEFFSQLENMDEDDMMKMVRLIERYAAQYLDPDNQAKIPTASESSYKLVSRLLTARMNCEQVYYLKMNSEAHWEYMFMIRRVSGQLAGLLERLRKYELARRVYDSVKFVDAVCRLYALELKEMQAVKGDGERQRQFALRMEYAKYMAEHSRQSQAVNLLQQTFERVNKIEQLTLVKTELTELMLAMKSSDHNTVYEESLFNGDYFSSLDQGVEEEIAAFADTGIESHKGGLFGLEME